MKIYRLIRISYLLFKFVQNRLNCKPVGYEECTHLQSGAVRDADVFHLALN